MLVTRAEHSHHGKVGKWPPPSGIPSEFAKIGGKPSEAFIEMQKQLFDSFDEANRAWLARARLEALLSIELINKLTAAHSISAAAAAYRDCMNQRLDMLAEDSRRMLDDSRKLLKAGTRLFSHDATGLAT